MTDEEDQAKNNEPVPTADHPDDDKWQDQELRKHALDVAQGQPHKLVSQIIQDAKAVYHFLTTKDPLKDEMPVTDEPKPAGPLEHYSERLPTFGDVGDIERPPAGSDNATVSPPGVPVIDVPQSEPAYPETEVHNPSPSARGI